MIVFSAMFASLFSRLQLRIDISLLLVIGTCKGTSKITSYNDVSVNTNTTIRKHGVKRKSLDYWR